MNISKIGGHNLFTPPMKTSTPKNDMQQHNALLQVEQDESKNAVNVSISKAGRLHSAMQHSLTVDNSLLDGVDIQKFKTALNGNGITRDNFVEFEDSSLTVDRTGGKLVIMPDDSQAEKYRKELLNATSLYGMADGAVGSSDGLNSLSSKYMELRKGIEEKYSNEELSEQLKLLDESYDNAVNTIAEHATFGIKSSAKIYEMSVKVNNALVKHGQTHGHTFGIPVNSIIEYDKDAFNKSVNTLVQNLQNSIKHFGALAKQYVLDGNNPTDKSAFEAYISQGVDESKGLYSLDDVDMLKTIFDPIGGRDMKGTLYSALDKVENSGISKTLKAAIIRMTSHSDRIFSVVPDDYKENSEKLYELMLKWEKDTK